MSREDLRARVSQEARGKVIAEMTFEREGPYAPYWVITFTDGSEMSVRLMSEIAMAEEPLARAAYAAWKACMDEGQKISQRSWDQLDSREKKAWQAAATDRPPSG